MSTRHPNFQSYSSINRSPSPIQNSLNVLLNGVKAQFIQNNIIESEDQIENILSSSQKNEFEDSYYVSNISNIINHLIAVIIEERQHNEGLMQQISQTIEDNDKKILQGLEVFVDLTHKMVDFSRDIFRKRPQEKSLPVEICRDFRQVYELTEELSNVFNDYSMENQQFLLRRNQLIALQIQFMQGVFIDQENQSLQQNQSRIQNTQSFPRASRNQTSHQTQEYILQLRQEISDLHQTLLKNDEEFTLEIQNYNKTLREMSATIKSYEIEFAKITNYDLRIQDLEKVIVRLREEKYRNQIVIENMAKKIRNFEKELKGDKAFISPQRQRLVSSPQSKFSMLSPKITGNTSVMNSINDTAGKIQIPLKNTLF